MESVIDVQLVLLAFTTYCILHLLIANLSKLFIDAKKLSSLSLENKIYVSERYFNFEYMTGD